MIGKGEKVNLAIFVSQFVCEFYFWGIFVPAVGLLYIGEFEIWRFFIGTFLVAHLSSHKQR